MSPCRQGEFGHGNLFMPARKVRSVITEGSGPSAKPTPGRLSRTAYRRGAADSVDDRLLTDRQLRVSFVVRLLSGELGARRILNLTQPAECT